MHALSRVGCSHGTDPEKTRLCLLAQGVVAREQGTATPAPALLF